MSMRLIEIGRPPSGLLRAVYVSLVSDQNNNISSSSATHLSQHSAARGLVDSCADILVSPTAVLSQLLVVGQTQLIQSDKFRALLHEHALEPIREAVVADWMVEACFRFTLVTRVSPEWNRLGSSLLQGVEFMKNMSKRNYRRITIDVHTNSSGQLYMKVKPDMVKMYPLELWELGTEKELRVQSFQLRLPGNQQRPFVSHWCYLLPKLSRGQIVGVRDNLPPDCSFKSYAGMREYWWKSYGYSLPEAPPRLYFDILFQPIGRQLFSYPSHCVLSGEPGPVRSDDRTLTLAAHAFVQVMARKMPNVCGQPLKLQLIQFPQPSHAFATARKRPNEEIDENANPNKRLRID